MNQQANLLRAAVEAKRRELIDSLIELGIYDSGDGRLLNELTLTELQEIARGVN